MAVLAPGVEVEWDYYPPVKGVARGVVTRIVGGMVYVARFRRKRNGDVVSSEGWFDPDEVDRIRVVGSPRVTNTGAAIEEHW